MVYKESFGSEIITSEMEQIKSMIAESITQRDSIKSEMEVWYINNPKKHFPKMETLFFTDTTLSELDSSYKRLWDYHNKK